MSDEHSYNAMGCSRHPIVKTPNLDNLAEEGTIFSNCYTNSPLCVPARAAWFTGKYVHRLGTWDNSTAYDGSIKGISHYLSEGGYEVASFGKTHFHCKGDFGGMSLFMPGLLKKPDLGAYYRGTGEFKPGAEKRFKDIEIRYEDSHDEKVCDSAIKWLSGKSKTDKPWMLNVGLFDPHFPFLVKKEYWDYYDLLVKVPPPEAMPPFTSLNEPLEALRNYFRCDVLDEEMIRRLYVGYYASVAQLDESVGRLLKTLDEQGLADDTMVIYTSDHGEQLGCHGLWWKCCMFEESAHIPLMIKVPLGISQNKIDSPVSLVDILPTICEGMGIPVSEALDGNSLLKPVMSGEKYRGKDFAFSEYHGHGSPTGMFMIRWKEWKYVYYSDYKSQLFNLNIDPRENNDLVQSNFDSDEVQMIIAECESRLKSVCDPNEIDKRAKRFQCRKQLELGINKMSFKEATKIKLQDPPHPEYRD